MTTTLAKSEVISLLNRLNHQIEQLERTDTEIVHGIISEGIDRDRVLELVQETIQEVIDK